MDMDIYVGNPQNDFSFFGIWALLIYFKPLLSISACDLEPPSAMIHSNACRVQSNMHFSTSV